MENKYDEDLSQKELIKALIECCEKQNEVLKSGESNFLIDIDTLRKLENERAVIAKEIEWEILKENITSKDELMRVKELNEKNRELLINLRDATKDRIGILRNRQKVAEAYNSNS